MRRNKSGFTLVELLVVITIIGMLMSLLLPAVNSARESARQLQCKNNMRQCAIAAVSYESRTGKFPGYRNVIGTNTANTAQAIGTWVVPLLSDLGRNDIADAWGDGPSTPAPVDLTTGVLNFLQAPSIDLLLCASDPPITQGDPKLSYVINAGIELTAYAFPPGTGGPQQMLQVSNSPANGIAHDSSTATTAGYVDSHDGLTTTLLFSERMLGERADAASRWDIGDQINSNGQPSLTHLVKDKTVFVWKAPPDSSLNMPAPSTYPDDVARVNGGSTGDPSVTFPRPSSSHPGGVVVTFCDTRTIYLQENVAYHVFVQLMTPWGARSSQYGNYTTYLLDDADYK